MKSKSTKSEFIEINIDLQKYATPLSILFVGILLSVITIIGFVSIANAIKEVKFDIVNSNTGQQNEQKVEAKNFEITASVDDDPYLGSADAPITIIEFAAYDCPFCQRHAQQTLPSLIEKYINTGKVRYVFRDSPLSGGGSNYQANIANCFKDLSNNSNEIYFRAHNFIYENFEAFRSNPDSLKDAIISLASSVGIDGNSVIECAKSGKFKTEIEKDQSDFSAIARSMGLQGLGVPSFVIGKANSEGTITAQVTLESTGEITGQLINGAYPFERFVDVIESLL